MFSGKFHSSLRLGPCLSGEYNGSGLSLLTSHCRAASSAADQNVCGAHSLFFWGGGHATLQFDSMVDDCSS